MIQKNEPQICIRPVNESDTAFVLDLNEKNVEMLAPMDMKRFEQFVKWAELFLVVEVDGQHAAFMIALREGNEEYDSENYCWFRSNYPSFLYVDRIVIDDNYRRLGLGRQLYEAVFTHAAEIGASVVTAEIDIEPQYNETSILFHKTMGFKEVDTQIIRNGKLKVSLQVKKQ